MFKKVLLVDDHTSVNSGVLDLLSPLDNIEVQVALYCDEAYLKVRKAAEVDKQPFDLIITDLSFKEDHRERELTSGEQLIKKIRSLYPDLPIIVYSMEDHFQKVRTLINNCGANAYVCKGRKGDQELLNAIKAVLEGVQFLSPEVRYALLEKEDREITSYDITLVQQLSQGLSQIQISEYLKNQGISPSSVSSVEKRLNRLKDLFRANNVIHLVTLMKDARLI